MNASVISALAALAGAMIGGLTSVLASWLSQRAQARIQWLTDEKIRRQELYKEFIEVASRCYVHAIQHDTPDFPGLVELYAEISRIHVVSSPQVVTSAEQIGQKIVDTYLEPDKTFLEIREMIKSRSIDLLQSFNESCRAEFAALRAQQF